MKRHEDRDRDRARPRHRIDDTQEGDQQDRGRDQEAERLEHQRERDQQGDDDQRLGPEDVAPERQEGRAAVLDGAIEDDERKDDHQQSGVEHHVAGTGIVDRAELQRNSRTRRRRCSGQPDETAPQLGVVDFHNSLPLARHPLRAATIDRVSCCCAGSRTCPSADRFRQLQLDERNRRKQFRQSFVNWSSCRARGSRRPCVRSRSLP